MTTGDKLSKLRKENNYTQEQLADVLGVSRQAISKWESNLTFPETDKLIRISELFDCSLDYLLKDTKETNDRGDRGEAPQEVNGDILRRRIRERKSEKLLFGMPLWHIGKNARGFIAIGLKARGVIALGLNARGILSMGLLSTGFFSMGLLSFGLLSAGMFAIGGMAAGSISLGIMAAGAVSVGIVSTGAVAVGGFSAGALAIGKYFAIGDRASAMIAIGDSSATGSVLQKLGKLSTQDIIEVKEALDAVTPGYLAWAKAFIELFL